MSDLPLLADIPLAEERDTLSLGAALGGLARTGDLFALHGPLGAGKTTLARGFITSRTTVTEDVVSPTFTLVQVYDAPTAPIWHFDLYRLDRSEDVFELGWEEALGSAISLVEWPGRLGALLPPGRLEVILSTEGRARRARVHGGAQWKDRMTGMEYV